MKIGIDIRNIGRQRTGSEAVVLELTKNILRLDQENEYYLFTDTQDAEVIENIKKNLELEEKNNAKIVFLRAMNKFVWVAWSVPRYLRKNKLDVYHTEYILPFFVPKSTKTVTHIHDVSFEAYPEMIKKSDLLFLKILIPRSIKKANKVIAVSEFTRKEIIKYYGIDSKKIELVFNATKEKESIFRSSEREKELIEKYSLPRKFILYVGTLQPRKNIPMLIEAFSKIKDKIGGVKLVVAGNKKAHNFDEKIDEAIERNGVQGDVIFPGFIDEKDKLELFGMAHVFVYLSLYEGFGIPLLEAMSQSTPVLSSSYSSLQEVGGNACLFADPEDLDEITDKLYTICMDDGLRKRLVSSGKNRVNFFSWESSAEKILKIYNSLGSKK